MHAQCCVVVVVIVVLTDITIDVYNFPTFGRVKKEDKNNQENTQIIPKFPFQSALWIKIVSVFLRWGNA